MGLNSCCKNWPWLRQYALYVCRNSHWVVLRSIKTDLWCCNFNPTIVTYNAGAVKFYCDLHRQSCKKYCELQRQKKQLFYCVKILFVVFYNAIDAVVKSAVVVFALVMLTMKIWNVGCVWVVPKIAYLVVSRSGEKAANKKCFCSLLVFRNFLRRWRHTPWHAAKSIHLTTVKCLKIK
jgi:hypothetical protein